ncbi:UDP-N-acetylmuramoyl-tripeptide--D-alanyl-D-alanine ligase [Waterburya agarophytonicola K14]|uniref:UDP-N-acetylmuramoyl-tripeptide--D-alanyl-D-alanine ligase n=1 Tax=Waterburya agarophytonicola KI4 TaxID=2874699 RepID=A0A964BVZ6_9CYAN|nr:UDP-N-acetylmuramoyl-tripeptide--D-alanyl-D-alanine ligase [Waterburya agarophytonicola]MCC0178892.1 UDP-N-acetylmuramoyl-tripeptide--D-alanyl-D-alanine ligase [Waterburya agarophytonicola KI4]
MTIYFSLSNLSDILSIQPLWKDNSRKLTTSVLGIATDTRAVKKGEIFVALTGDRFDGHNFVDAAIAKGAIALIVDRPLENKSVPQFIVADTLEAYQRIARWWRSQLNIPVIGITGSVGKTSTKELVAAVLSTQGKVLKTEANFNNEIGVPKTLLQITPEHDYAVIEMAMRGEGEIALLTDIVCPTIGIITNVGTAHIGRLGSREAIARAKCELLAQMPQSSTAILNYDNRLLIDTAKKVWQGETITYGMKGGGIQGAIDGDKINALGYSLPLPLTGEHNASNYLAAVAVAQLLNIDLAVLVSGINVELPKGRSRRYDLANDIVVLDETYNAGLESMLAAVQMLKETPGKRHIAVLGTMKELGEYSPQLHRQVGEKGQELGLDMLLVLADEKATQEIAKGAGNIATECFSDRATLTTKLKQIMRSGDRILCKASNSVGLNEVVEELVVSG